MIILASVAITLTGIGLTAWVASKEIEDVKRVCESQVKRRENMLAKAQEKITRQEQVIQVLKRELDSYARKEQT